MLVVNIPLKDTTWASINFLVVIKHKEKIIWKKIKKDKSSLSSSKPLEEPTGGGPNLKKKRNKKKNPRSLENLLYTFTYFFWMVTLY